LNWHRNYSSVQTTSPGELHAAQGRATRQRMAEDRRVDIYSSHVAQRHVIGQPIAITDNTQRIPRIVFRSFSRRAVTPLAGPPGPVLATEQTKGLLPTDPRCHCRWRT
jgi:hypothetical protein